MEGNLQITQENHPHKDLKNWDNCVYCQQQIKQQIESHQKNQDTTEEKQDNIVEDKKEERMFKRSAINKIREKISIAPMVDVTDNYFRYFARFLTKHSFLYTEMINEHAIINIYQSGNQKLLNFTPNQHPVVCQIGGNDPIKAAKAAKIIEEWGYDEVNLNCGCPSQKTVNGCFGAQLMFDPDLVAAICQEMIQTVNIPVTVKCRLGVDDVDKWENIVHFIKTVSEKGGVNKFIIHARKAFLKGLDPKQNRTIPPLKYDWVLKLKQEFPHLDFLINGGFTEIQAMHDILKEENQLMGCMVGRLAMNNTWDVAKFDSEFFGSTESTLNREEMMMQYADFVQEEMNKEFQKTGKYCSNTIMVRPLINLFVGEYRGSEFRKTFNQMAVQPKYKGNVKQLIIDAIDFYRQFNPEALKTVNGQKIFKPTHIKSQEEEELNMQINNQKNDVDHAQEEK